MHGGLSARVAGHVAGFPAAALPQGARHAAKRALLDGLGVMLGASGASPDVHPFVAMALAAGGPARGAAGATVLGHGAAVPAELAAFANGAMAHALDFEDAFDAAPCHPNASLLPAALAIAESHGPVTGEALLAAIAIGCDLVCRMGLALRREMEAGGWYPPPILGAYGAAAAAARLLGLDARATLDALSLTLCQATMPGEIKHSRDTVIRAVREAFPAQAAIRSALLARAGVRGFDAPLEGEGGFYRLYADGAYAPEVILDGLGVRFWIDALTFKRWPSCRGTHAYIEGIQRIRATHAFACTDVAEVVAVGGAVHRMLVDPVDRKRAPATTIDAKFSIPYAVAAALADDEVTLLSFDPAAIADPARRALAALVGFEERADWGRDRAAAGQIRIALRDGRRFDADVPVAVGHPDVPLSDAALTEKFVACAARAHRPVAPARARALAQAIWSIERSCDVGATIRGLSYAP